MKTRFSSTLFFISLVSNQLIITIAEFGYEAVKGSAAGQLSFTQEAGGYASDQNPTYFKKEDGGRGSHGNSTSIPDFIGKAKDYMTNIGDHSSAFSNNIKDQVHEFLEGPAEKYLHRVMWGGRSVKQAIDHALAEADEVLSENIWPDFRSKRGQWLQNGGGDIGRWRKEHVDALLSGFDASGFREYANRVMSGEFFGKKKEDAEEVLETMLMALQEVKSLSQMVMNMQDEATRQKLVDYLEPKITAVVAVGEKKFEELIFGKDSPSTTLTEFLSTKSGKKFGVFHKVITGLTLLNGGLPAEISKGLPAYFLSFFEFGLLVSHPVLSVEGDGSTDFFIQFSFEDQAGVEVSPGFGEWGVNVWQHHAFNILVRRTTDGRLKCTGFNWSNTNSPNAYLYFDGEAAVQSVGRHMKLMDEGITKFVNKIPVGKEFMRGVAEKSKKAMSLMLKPKRSMSSIAARQPIGKILDIATVFWNAIAGWLRRRQRLIAGFTSHFISTYDFRGMAKENPQMISEILLVRAAATTAGFVGGSLATPYIMAVTRGLGLMVGIETAIWTTNFASDLILSKIPRYDKYRKNEMFFVYIFIPMYNVFKDLKGLPFNVDFLTVMTFLLHFEPDFFRHVPIG